MTDEAKETRNKYYREWRKKNPDKARAITERYWERQAKKVKQEKATNG